MFKPIFVVAFLALIALGESCRNGTSGIRQVREAAGPMEDMSNMAGNAMSTGMGMAGRAMQIPGKFMQIPGQAMEGFAGMAGGGGAI